MRDENVGTGGNKLGTKKASAMKMAEAKHDAN
jgi:hypothetical protein